MSDELLNVDGTIAIRQGSVPGLAPGHSKLYATSHFNGELHVKYDTGRSHRLAGPLDAHLYSVAPSPPWIDYDVATYGDIKMAFNPANDTVHLQGAVFKAVSGANTIMTIPLSNAYFPDTKQEFICPASVNGTEHAVLVSVDANGYIVWEYTYGVGVPSTTDLVDWAILTPLRWRVTV
jgi:hypothetical protein